jgi:protoporphyrinogen oxidase
MIGFMNAERSMTRTTKHIGVIGGGIAGLTTAYRLATAGYRVSLWERGQRLGGQAAAFPVEGSDLEFFYHHLFQSDTDIVGLMEELGIGDRLMWLPSDVGYFADGRIYPLNGAKDLLSLGFLPFHDRLRLGLVTAYLQRFRNWHEFEKVTAEQWLRRALGSRAYDRTFGAQLEAKFGRYHDQIAMVWFWGKIWLRTTSRSSPLAKEKLGYPRGSFNIIVDALVSAARTAGARLQTGFGPMELRPNEDGSWQLVFEGDVEEHCDAIVVTTPSPILSRLVPSLPNDFQSLLTGLEYEAAVVALLELNQPLTSTYWLNIADRDLPFTAVIEHTNFVSPSMYDGHHYVYLSKYLEPDHPYFSMSDDELLAAYRPFLQRLNPRFDSGWITRSWVFRERAAQPIITRNYSQRLPDHRTPLPNLYLANTSQIYPEDRGTNYSVRLGKRVAAIVEEDDRSGAEWPH